MRSRIALLVGLLMAAVPATADPRCFVNGTGDDLLLCDAGAEVVFIGTGEGGVCFEAGHIQPNFGLNRLTIVDDIITTPSGYYCQDKDMDGTCDDDTDSPFCVSITLVDGGNWDPSFAVLVFADGVVFGNPVTSACGFTVSPSLSGCVFHE